MTAQAYRALVAAAELWERAEKNGGVSHADIRSAATHALRLALDESRKVEVVPTIAEIQQHPEWGVLAVIPRCPKCGGEWVFYDGALGYESSVCKLCRFDIGDVKLAIKPLSLSIG